MHSTDMAIRRAISIGMVVLTIARLLLILVGMSAQLLILRIQILAVMVARAGEVGLLVSWPATMPCMTAKTMPELTAAQATTTA
jgi:hypothetical protein